MTPRVGKSLGEKSVIGWHKSLRQNPGKIIDARLVIVGQIVGFDTSPAVFTILAMK